MSDDKRRGVQISSFDGCSRDQSPRSDDLSRRGFLRRAAGVRALAAGLAITRQMGGEPSSPSAFTQGSRWATASMQLGWNLEGFDYYTSQWPSVNVVKWMSTIGFSGSGQTGIVPLDADGKAMAAWSAQTTTLDIRNAEPGTLYGRPDTETVVTTSTDHDYTYGSYPTSVRIFGNGKVSDGIYSVKAVLGFRQFVIAATVDEASGPSGTAACCPVAAGWEPTALTCRNIAGKYPKGTYDFYNGSNVTFQWRFDVSGNLSVNARSWASKTVVPTRDGIQLMTSSDWSNGGDFKAIMPMFKAAYEAGTMFWHPTFLSLLAQAMPATCVRHMDTGRTNNSNVRTWSQRTPRTRYNSLYGKVTHRPVKLTGALCGEQSAYFGSRSTITFTAPSHGLRTGDIIYIRQTNASPSISFYHFQVEVVDASHLRVLHTNPITVTWGWADANIHAGCAYEHIIDLHNTLGIDVWVNIPHLADDDYVTQMATLFATTLKPDLNVYVEWSNETWQVGSTAFIQGHYCACQSRLDPVYNNQNKWAGKRARECFDLWDAAYVAAGTADPRTRVCRVAATQNANTAVTRSLLFGLTDPGTRRVKADVLAVAPYYWNLDSYNTIAELKTQCLAYISRNLVPWMAAQKASAEAAVNDRGLSLKLVAYEGGQSLTSTSDVARAFATSAARYDCDTALFKAAEAAGIMLWCHFTFMHQEGIAAGRYYQWGALSHMTDVADAVYRPTWKAIGDYFRGARESSSSVLGGRVSAKRWPDVCS